MIQENKEAKEEYKIQGSQDIAGCGSVMKRSSM